MFATVAEAERAARVVSRITRRRAEVWPEADIGIAVGFVDEAHFAPGYASWDELAAFLERGYNPLPPDDDRLAQARERIATLHEAIERTYRNGNGWSPFDPFGTFSSEAMLIAGLCSALEAVLEALG